jgi:integrase
VKTSKVTIWAIRRNNSSKKPSWVIRWKTADKAHSQTRGTKALAESFRSELLQATKRGEEFDVETGLPDSMVEPEPETEPVRSVLTVAQEYVVKRWPHDPPKTRDGITDALATVIPVLVDKDQAGAPKPRQLRTALRSYILLPPDKRPEPWPPFVRALTWLESASLPITDLDDAKVTRDALDQLALQLNGKAAAPNTIKRKRAAFHNFLEYAVEIKELPSNPIHKVKWRLPKSSDTVDPRVAVNQKQARALLDAAAKVGDSGQGRGRGKRLWPMFACMYYAAMRPGEVVALREGDCHLPAKGWGRLTLAKSRPESNRKWTDSHDAHEERGLKHRAETEVRVVPIPPVLVAILREHIKTYGVGENGRIFNSERGKPVASTAYTEVWQDARNLTLTPTQVASPLAARPYDLRHAAVSLWLNGGVSPTEIAKRAGHSVEVLLRVYANCVVGQDKVANRRIEEILSQDPDEEDDNGPGDDTGNHKDAS